MAAGECACYCWRYPRGTRAEKSDASTYPLALAVETRGLDEVAIRTATRLCPGKPGALADETRLELSICHFPPGTSKWSKIEHRPFRLFKLARQPLRDCETVAKLIARTTTAQGLCFICRLDRRKYPTGRMVSDEEMSTVNLEPNRFHGDWNYVIRPHSAVF